MGVHMRQHLPSLWPLSIPVLSSAMPLTFSSSELIALSLESVLYGAPPLVIPLSSRSSLTHRSHHQGSMSPCLPDASASSTTSDGEGEVEGTTASSWSRSPFSSSSHGFVPPCADHTFPSCPS